MSHQTEQQQPLGNLLETIRFIHALFNGTTPAYFASKGVTGGFNAQNVITILKLVCAVMAGFCPAINNSDAKMSSFKDKIQAAVSQVLTEHPESLNAQIERIGK